MMAPSARVRGHGEHFAKDCPSRDGAPLGGGCYGGSYYA
eukprot:gene15756-47341_t